MLVLFRTLIYGTVFVGLLFLYLPWRLLAWSGIRQPAAMGWAQIAGVAIGSTGAVIVLACVASFVSLGKGTPAPFDPPRRLVVCGPYRFVRNPMYIGAALALGGVALFYHSAWITVYGVGLLIAANLLVILYEEPILRHSFGAEYEAYCLRVHRWIPQFVHAGDLKSTRLD